MLLAGLAGGLQGASQGYETYRQRQVADEQRRQLEEDRRLQREDRTRQQAIEGFKLSLDLDDEAGATHYLSALNPELAASGAVRDYLKTKREAAARQKASDLADLAGRLANNKNLSQAHKDAAYKAAGGTFPTRTVTTPATVRTVFRPVANGRMLPLPTTDKTRIASTGTTLPPSTPIARNAQGGAYVPVTPAKLTTKPASTRTVEDSPFRERETVTVDIGGTSVELPADSPSTARILANLQPRSAYDSRRGQWVTAPGAPGQGGAAVGSATLPVAATPRASAGGSGGKKSSRDRIQVKDLVGPDGKVYRYRVNLDTGETMKIGMAPPKGSGREPDPLVTENRINSAIAKKFPRTRMEAALGQENPELAKKRGAYAAQLRRTQGGGKQKSALDRLLEAK
jgi:hypothetical protein